MMKHTETTETNVHFCAGCVNPVPSLNTESASCGSEYYCAECCFALFDCWECEVQTGGLVFDHDLRAWA